MAPQNNIFAQPNQSAYFPTISTQQRSQSTPLPYKFGSTREDFQQFRMEYIKKDANEEYSYSSALMQQRAYDKMNNIMLRIEDYYLIRSGQVDGQYKRNLEAAVQNQNFPTSLIQNQQNLNCPVFFPDKARSQWNSQGMNYQSNTNNWQNNNRQNNYTNNNNNNFFSSANNNNNNTNMFTTQQNTNNMFTNQSSIQSGNNIFAANTSNSNMFASTNNTNNNYLLNSQRPTANIFQQQQPQQNMFQNHTQNLFQQPNTQVPLIQPPIFQQPTSMFNSTPNLFPQTNNLFAQNNNMFQQNRIPTILQPQPMMNQYGFQPQWSYGQIQPLLPMIPMNPYTNPMQVPKMDDQTLTTTISFLQQELERNQALREQEKQEQDKQHELLLQAAQIQQQRIEENERRIQRSMAISSRNQARSISPNLQISRMKSRSPSPLNRSQYSKFPNQSRISNVNRSTVQSNFFSRSPASRSPIRVSDSIKPCETRPVICNINSIVSCLQSGKVYEQTLNIKISNDLAISDLKFKILDQLKNDYNLIPIDHQLDKYFTHSIFKIGNDQVISDNQKLHSLPKEMNIQFELSSCPMIPRINNSRFQSNPDIKQLSRMNLLQLQCVEDFEIWNEYGKIMWPGKSDVSYQNFDEILKIHSLEVEMYDVDTLGDFIKPEVGIKLNKTCEVTFKFPENIIKEYDLLNNPQNHQKIYQQFLNMAKQQQLQMIDYNQENLTYKVQIDHFTKYSFKLVSSQKFQEQPNQPQESRFIENQNLRQPKRPNFQTEEELIEEDHKESLQQEKIEEMKHQVNQLREQAKNDLSAPQMKINLPFITPLNERVMKFNLRVFDEDERKCEIPIYLTQVTGASFTNHGRLMKFCPNSIEIYSQIQDREDDIIFMLECLSKGVSNENELSNILYEFISIKFSTQQEPEDSQWYLPRLEMLNTLMGNPAVCINKEQINFYDLATIRAIINPIRKQLLLSQLEKLYWDSHYYNKQQELSDFRLFKLRQYESNLNEDPLDLVLLTSQNTKIFTGSQFYQNQNLSLETQWIGQLLENVISHQEDQTFFNSLVKYVQNYSSESIIALIITAYLTFITQDNSLFYKTLAIIENTFLYGDLRSRTIALVVFYVVSFKTTQKDQKRALRFVTRNISSSLQHQMNGTTSQSIVLFQNLMSKNIANNKNHEQLIQKQAAERFLSLRCLKELPEASAAENLILYHLQKKQYSQALDIAFKYNYSSYYIQILTQYQLPILIIYQIENDSSGKDLFKDEIFKQVKHLNYHKKQINSLKKNSISIEKQWWKNVGKLLKKLALLPFYRSYKDKIAMEKLKHEIINWQPKHLYQIELKQQCIQYIDLRLP